MPIALLLLLNYKVLKIYSYDNSLKSGHQNVKSISHDLRTPLTSIQGYLTLLQECEDKQEQGQCIKIIKAKTDYLTDLVQEFYDLSVIENEQVDVECERVYSGSVVKTKI